MVNLMSKDDNLLIIKRNEFCKIEINTISYIEKIKNTKYLKIITTNKQDFIKVKYNIKDCLSLFKDYRFFLLNKSVVLNVGQIKEFHLEQIPYIKFYNGLILNISLNNIRKLKQNINQLM